MRKNEDGTILIEFVGSFLLFVLLILSVLSLVNINTMQARMHYALTQAASTLSMYGYVLSVIELDDFMMNVNGSAPNLRRGVDVDINEISDVLRCINNLDIKGLNKAGTVVTKISDQVDGILNNPTQALKSIACYALNECGSAAFEQILRPLVAYHLANGDMSGDEYLRSVGVEGGMESLQFHTFSLPGHTPPQNGQIVGSLTSIGDRNSILLNKDGNVKITVQYSMDYSFMGLDRLLPFEPKLLVTQSVATAMWLGGRGDEYKD